MAAKKIFTLLMLFFLFLLSAHLSFAKNNKSSLLLASDNKNKNTTKDTKVDKSASFKRFEIGYDSLWLSGNGYAEGRWNVAGIFNDDYAYKANLKTRLDEYKMLFYFTPRIYFDGSFAMGGIQKNEPGWFDITSTPLGTLSADGASCVFPGSGCLRRASPA